MSSVTPRTIPTTREQRQTYAGQYELGISGWNATVTERDGKLWFQIPPLEPMPLVYVGENQFVHEGEPYGYRLTFGPDAPNRELQLLGMGMMHWYGRRLP